MAERFCLRCDWTGETSDADCPRCGAPLYRLGSEPAPAEPPIAEAPPEPLDVVPATHHETAREDEVRDEENVPPPVTSGERGRWRVIALALTLTAVVGFALTRGGEADPRTEPEANGQAPTGSATPSPSIAEVLPACSDDPSPSLPFPEPADSVPAATADYLFQGSLSSSLGRAPDLAEIVGGSAVFTVDGRTGTTVLRFAGGRGLELTPTTGIVPTSRYTMEILFRFDFMTGYRKIVDFKDGTADGGLYMLDGCLTFFPNQPNAVTPIGSDSYVQVILTRDATDQVVGYVNGVRQFVFDDSRGRAEVSERAILRFFVDDHTTTGEYSSGAVSQIRLFDQALTESEVAALACSELAIADATFACREIQQ